MPALEVAWRLGEGRYALHGPSVPDCSRRRQGRALGVARRQWSGTTAPAPKGRRPALQKPQQRKDGADATRAGEGQGRLRDHQHPQAELRALAQVDGREAPLCGPCHELRGAEPCARRQGLRHGHPAELLVRPRREQAPLLLRRHLDAVAWGPPRQGRAKGLRALRVPHDRAQRRRQADPRESYAGDPHDQEEVETWLSAPYEEATKLQRPLSDDLTAIVPAPTPVEDVTAPKKAQWSLFLRLSDDTRQY